MFCLSFDYFLVDPIEDFLIRFFIVDPLSCPFGTVVHPYQGLAGFN